MPSSVVRSERAGYPLRYRSLKGSGAEKRKRYSCVSATLLIIYRCINATSFGACGRPGSEE